MGMPESGHMSAEEKAKEEIASNPGMNRLNELIIQHMETTLKGIDLTTAIKIATDDYLAEIGQNGATCLPGAASTISGFEDVEESADAYIAKIKADHSAAITEIGVEERCTLVKELHQAIMGQVVYSEALNIDRRAEHPEVQIPAPAGETDTTEGSLVS